MRLAAASCVWQASVFRDGFFYARQLHRQVVLRARISYGNSVRLSVCLGCQDPLPNQAQVRYTPGFHRMVA